jgi:hypothetical protein
MKKYLLIIIIILICLSGFTQNNWITKKVGNELSVKFPKEPYSDTKPEKRLTLYTIKSDNSNCSFLVLRRTNAMPDYDRIKNLPLSHQEKEINLRLDKAIADFIQDNKIITPLKQIKVGKYIGKQLTYSQLDETTNHVYTQFTKFVFANNNVYIIQCSIYIAGECENEKNFFLNSITSN